MSQDKRTHELSYRLEPMDEHEVIDVAQMVLSGYGFQFGINADIRTDNPTLLFNISGGVQYEDVLSGDQYPPAYPRQASVQRCIRANGLSKVGRTGRHHIAFDMLGHFSFFEFGEAAAKQLAITSAVATLQQLGIQNLFARVHPDDVLSMTVLEGLEPTLLVSEDNTHVCNQRRRSGTRVELGRITDGVTTELWNIVFTTHEGIDEKRSPLGIVAFDSGASIDRLTAAANGLSTDYEVASWVHARRTLSGLDEGTACRITDFARAAAVMVSCDVMPGPKAEQYIVRKVFAELVRARLHAPEIIMDAVIRDTIQAHGLAVEPERVVGIYRSEEDRFERLLRQGTRVVMKGMLRHGEQPTEEDYGDYKQTYGLDQEVVDWLLTAVSNQDL